MVQGKYSRTKFSVLKETGDDKLALGIPWLEKTNPVIDWKERTIKFHGNNNGSNWSPKIGMLDTMEKECTKEEQPNADEKHSAAYYKELQEIREELPEEIKDFADVFCSED